MFLGCFLESVVAIFYKSQELNCLRNVTHYPCGVGLYPMQTPDTASSFLIRNTQAKWPKLLEFLNIRSQCESWTLDRADTLARQGTSNAQHDEHVSYATSKQIIQTKYRKMWHDRWARGNTGRTYYQHQQTPNQTYPINQLHRAHQTAIFRLRTQHAPLNAHLQRTKKQHPQSVSTAPTVMRLLNISCSTAHCTTTSGPVCMKAG